MNIEITLEDIEIIEKYMNSDDNSLPSAMCKDGLEPTHMLIILQVIFDVLAELKKEMMSCKNN